MAALTKKLILLTISGSLISTLCVPMCFASNDVRGTGDGWDATVRRETSTPGGFSSVAEPAGPIDPEAAKRAAEKYRFHCVTMPKLVAFFDKTEVITPEDCKAQANTGAPLAAGPTTVSNEQVARLIPHGSGINRYPSGEIFVIFKQPMMVWTSPDKQTFNILCWEPLLRLRLHRCLLTGTGETDSPSKPQTPARRILTTVSATPMRLLVMGM